MPMRYAMSHTTKDPLKVVGLTQSFGDHGGPWGVRKGSRGVCDGHQLCKGLFLASFGLGLTQPNRETSRLFALVYPVSLLRCSELLELLSVAVLFTGLEAQLKDYME